MSFVTLSARESNQEKRGLPTCPRASSALLLPLTGSVYLCAYHTALDLLVDFSRRQLCLCQYRGLRASFLATRREVVGLRTYA